MKVATWNINGIKARIDSAVAWLKDAGPEIACLQEIKSVDEQFPGEAFEELGYNVATHGQKGFNGVAVLSKLPFDEIRRGLPGNEADEQARYLEVAVSTDRGSLRVASIYLPNGNPVTTEKFAYKLSWMDRLHAHAAALLQLEEPVVLAGDYNVIPQPEDARYPENWLGDALFQPESRSRLRALVNLGYTDALRASSDAGGIYTFWDYQGGAWQKNDGIRIDHALLSPMAADAFTGVLVDKRTRGWEKPSDHVPVIAEMTFGAP